MINSLFVVITMEYYACGHWFANEKAKCRFRVSIALVINSMLVIKHERYAILIYDRFMYCWFVDNNIKSS